MSDIHEGKRLKTYIKVNDVNVDQDLLPKLKGVMSKAAGIEKRISSHSLRHSYVTRLLLHTGNLKLAGALAGHSSIRETEKYAHLADNQKRGAVDQLG